MTGIVGLGTQVTFGIAQLDAPRLIWGASGWLPVSGAAAATLLILLVVGYWRAPASAGVRWLAASLKALAVIILALCLLEPLLGGTRARPGANQFVVLADNSQSMSLKDRGAQQSRGEQLKSITGKASAWLGQLGRDFDLRQFAFDAQLRAVDDFSGLAFDGRDSDLGAALERLTRRYQARPLAGVVLLTDGSATDAETLDRLIARSGSASGGAAKPQAEGAVRLPPIYPVLMGKDAPARDVSLERVAVSQTNFEDTPVTLTAQITTSGHQGKTIVAQLLDESGKTVEQHQKIKVDKDGEPLALRFSVKPTQPGLSFYQIRAAAEDQLAQFDKAADAAASANSAETQAEATLANNTRTVAVDRGRGPYRVLYVAGRPNWEYKFLQRAVQGDDQVQLLGFIRIARREPKFNFIGRAGDRENPLFRGFEVQNKEQVEQYDQPVIVRMGTRDENELRGGFPKEAQELYQYHAVILDDVESEFFTQDQMQLLKDFVRQRGGGLLMLGGQESFKNGKYDRTPIGDLLPVYVDEVSALPPGAKHRLALTREGWLEPWVRLRAEEDAEQRRLAAMPAFQTLNPIRGIKPGATVLARAALEGQSSAVPALVEQRFGQGRVAALLVGDLWRWDLRRPANTESDLQKAWRQTIRWLVAEVPKRVEITTSQRNQPEDPDGSLALSVNVRDPAYAPLDNATVAIKVTGPDQKPLELRAEASARQPGRYEALFVPRQPGAYRAHVTAAAPDGSEIGNAQTGWTTEPAAEEFKHLRPNAELLERIAKSTGGQVVKAGDLESFVATLPTRHAQITEPYIRPLWHQSWVFLLAITCLAAEWGLRRWKGLP